MKGEERTATRYDGPPGAGGQEVNKVVSRFDPLGQLRSEAWTIDGETYTMKYGYDGAGRLNNVTYPDTSLVGYEYDEAGRLIKVPGYVQNGLSAGFDYKANGFLKTIYYANGAITTLEPDNRNRPSQISTSLHGLPLFNVQYVWDYEGNVTHINGAPQSYDGLNRLTTSNTPLPLGGSHTVSYGYDLAGNRTSETHSGITTIFSNNSSNQLTARTVAGQAIESFTYTGGAMETRISNGTTTTYSYDDANRLRTVAQDGQLLAEYTYDAYGRLVKTVEYDSGTSRTTIRLPIGTETAYEVITEGNDVLEQKYIRGNGMYLARVDRLNSGTPQTYFYHTDHLGSTRAVSGAQNTFLTYDPFGNLIASSGNVDDHAYRFTGKPMDSTGLYYYGARFYDPTIGRFISLDPAMDGLNWYAYVRNNPLKYVDPDGKAPWDWFETSDHAALDFAETYFDDSLRMEQELGSIIFRLGDQYSYTDPVTGCKGNCDPKFELTIEFKSPVGTHGVAQIHTHWPVVNRDVAQMSSSDRNWMNRHMRTHWFMPNELRTMYVVAPDGVLRNDWIKAGQYATSYLHFESNSDEDFKPTNALQRFGAFLVALFKRP